MLDDIRDNLSGYKTYILALVGITAALGAWVNGSMDSQTFVKTVIEAALAMTLRAGIAKGQ